MESKPTPLPVAAPEQEVAARLIALASNKRLGRSLTEALDELDRELNVRDRCYARWQSEGKLTKTDARDRMDRMAAAFHFLTAFQDLAVALMPAQQQQPESDNDGGAQ